MKMEPIVSSETSAIRTQTPGNYPKRNKSHITRSFMICTLRQIYLGDQIKKKEISGACSTYGRYEKCIQGFGGKT